MSKPDPAMVRRLIQLYGAASADDLSAGLEWYAKCYRTAAAMLPNDPKRAAGVIAILSPRVRWATNLQWAAQIIAAAERGDAEPPPVHTGAMRAIAWRIATNQERPETAIRGIKTSNFYRAIIGDGSAVTIDVWARRAAEGNWRDWHVKSETGARDVSMSNKIYREIAAAYTAAAEALGVPARDVQAAVWVHVRGAAG